MRNFLSGGTISFDALTPTEHSPLVLEAGALSPLPIGEALRDAEFTRSGPDLLINSGAITIRDYFNRPEAIYSDSGLKIEPDAITTLAGSLAPSQYAGPNGAKIVIGVVSKLQGEAVVKHADGTETSLKNGDPVYQNDIIRTGKDSGVGITFNDKSVFAVGSNARMTLDKLVYDEATGEGESSVTVLKGMFKFVSGEIAAHNPGDMKIKTPVATIGIRGTTGGGVVEGEGQDNSFYLAKNADGTHGKFDVVTDGGKITIDQPFAYVPVKSVHDTFSGVALKAMPAPMMQEYNNISTVTPAGKYDALINKQQPGAPAQPEAPAQQQKKTDAAPQGEQTQTAQGESTEAAPQQGGQPAEAAPQAEEAAVPQGEPSPAGDAPLPVMAALPEMTTPAAAEPPAPPADASLSTDAMGRPKDQGVFSTDKAIGLDFANQVVPSAATANAASKPAFIEGANNPAGTEFAPQAGSIAAIVNGSNPTSTEATAAIAGQFFAPNASGAGQVPLASGTITPLPQGSLPPLPNGTFAPPPPPANTGTFVPPPPVNSGILPPPPAGANPPPPPAGGINGGGGAGGVAGGPAGSVFTLTAGNDTVTGSDGADTIYSPSSGNFGPGDVIQGGNGYDIAVLQSTSTVAVGDWMNKASIEQLQFNAVSTVSIDNTAGDAFINSTGGNTLILDHGTHAMTLNTQGLSSLLNVVVAGSGAVSLNGNSRAFIKLETEGNIIGGGASTMTVVGGAMNDTVSVNSTAGSNLNLVGGDDTVSINLGTLTIGGAAHQILAGNGMDTLVINGMGGSWNLTATPNVHGFETFKINTTSAATNFTFQETYFSGGSYPITGNVITIDATGSTQNNTLDAQAIVTTPVGFYMLAGTGDVSMTGSGFSDSLVGSTGRDTLTGGTIGVNATGSDTLLGGDGNDLLNGTNGADLLLGGVGNDTIAFTNKGDFSSNQTIFGAAGDDVLEFSSTYGGSSIPLNGLPNISGIEGFHLYSNGVFSFSVDDHYFGRGGLTNNTIIVDHGGYNGGLLFTAEAVTNPLFNVSVTGGSQNDEIIGSKNADTLTGGTGKDFFEGGSGADVINADATQGDFFVYNLNDPNCSTALAADTITGFSAVLDKILIIGGGFGDISYSFSSGGGVSASATDMNVTSGILRIATPSGIEVNGITGASGSNFIAATWNGGMADDVKVGTNGGGSDVLVGFAGNDWLRGGTTGGNDLLMGGQGNDTLDSEDTLTCTLLGGVGEDILIRQGTSTNTIFDGGVGFDTLKILAADVANFGGATLTYRSIEKLDMVNGTGTAGCISGLHMTASTIKDGWLNGGTDFTIARDAGDTGSITSATGAGGWVSLGTDALGYSIYGDTGGGGTGVKIHTNGPISGTGTATLNFD